MPLRNTIDRLSGAAAHFLEKKKTIVLAIQAILLVLSLFLCFGIRSNTKVGLPSYTLPGVPIAAEKNALDFITIAFDVGHLSIEGHERRVSDLATRLEEGSAWWTVRVPDSLGTAYDRLLFRSADGETALIFLDLRKDADPGAWYPFLRDFRGSESGLRISGMPWVDAFIENSIIREFILLWALAATVLFAVYLLMFRSVWRAGRLWFASAAPALMTAAFFPLFGVELDVYTIIAPACALAVGTAYAVHASRGLEELRGDLAALFSTRGPAMVLDWFTTVLGFATLVVAPSARLRILGVASIFGATASFAVGLFVFPLLELKEARSRPPSRTAAQGDVRSEPTGGATGREDRGMVRGFAGISGRLRHITFILLFLAMGVCISGFGRISVRSSLASSILPRTEVGSDAAFIEERFGALDEIVLTLDTGSEYGLVDMDLFRRLENFEALLAANSLVSRVYGYRDVVRNVLALNAAAPDDAAMESRPDRSSTPRSAEEIGEALELFSNSRYGRYLDLLTDASWRVARIRVRLVRGHEGRVLAKALARWSVAAREAGLPEKMSWSGSPITVAATNLAMVQSFVMSGITYFAAIFAILLAVLKSPRRALLIVFPSLIGCAVAVSLAGIIGWPLDMGSAFSLSVIEGIGIDDALVFVLARKRNRMTYRSIIEATLVLVAILASFLASSFMLIVQVFVITTAGLAVSTAIVLLVLPRLVRDGRVERCAGLKELP